MKTYPALAVEGCLFVDRETVAAAHRSSAYHHEADHNFEAGLDLFHRLVMVHSCRYYCTLPDEARSPAASALEDTAEAVVVMHYSLDCTAVRCLLACTAGRTRSLPLVRRTGPKNHPHRSLGKHRCRFAGSSASLAGRLPADSLRSGIPHSDILHSDILHSDQHTAAAVRAAVLGVGLGALDLLWALAGCSTAWTVRDTGLGRRPFCHRPQKRLLPRRLVAPSAKEALGGGGERMTGAPS